MMCGMKPLIRTYLTGRYAPVTAAVLLIAAGALGALASSPLASRLAYYVVTGH